MDVTRKPFGSIVNWLAMAMVHQGSPFLRMKLDASNGKSGIPNSLTDANDGQFVITGDIVTLEVATRI